MPQPTPEQIEALQKQMGGKLPDFPGGLPSMPKGVPGLPGLGGGKIPGLPGTGGPAGPGRRSPAACTVEARHARHICRPAREAGIFLSVAAGLAESSRLYPTNRAKS